MRISIRNTKLSITIPDGYEVPRGKNPLRQLQGLRDGISVYQKRMENAVCTLTVRHLDVENAMTFHDITDGRANPADQYDLLESKDDTTAHGYYYSYDLVRSAGDAKTGADVRYVLQLILAHEGEVCVLLGDFTGVASADCPTNQSEQEERSQPIQEARELLRAVVTDATSCAEAEAGLVMEQTARKLPFIEARQILESGASLATRGLEHAKHTAVTVKTGVEKAVTIVHDKGREAQIAVLKQVDDWLNKQILEAKDTAFQDGWIAARAKAIESIKWSTNFLLATTALSYYFARCDGSIHEAEQLELEHDLDAITKNRDLPAAVQNCLAQIEQNDSLSFEEVCTYLDRVGFETLMRLSNDVDEIIFADRCLSLEEELARERFDAYVRRRREAETND